MKVGLLNGVIITVNGLFRISDITVPDACRLVQENGFISAIGHQATAEMMSELLQVDVQPNRIELEQQPGQLVIALKLSKRLPEGAVISRDEMEEIGFSLKLIRRYE